MIQEPPAGTELHVTRHRSVVEITNTSGHDLIVGGVEVVHDRPGKFVAGIQPVKETSQGAGLREITDTIPACVGAKLRQFISKE